jgi:hypothetical protein
MLIAKQKLTLLNAIKKQGIKKDGQPYLFYTASLLDSESNVLKMNLSNELSKNTALTTKLDTAKQVPCTIDFSIYQSGFNLKGTVVKIDL